MRVLFVCLGNICRSPTAEGVLRAMAPDLDIDSAGTGDWHIGDPPHGPALAAAARRGYDLHTLRARQVDRDDFDRFDLILAMDRKNLAHLETLRPAGSTAQVRLFLDYTEDLRGCDVPDPYFTGDFEGALDLIETASSGLLKEIGRG